MEAVQVKQGARADQGSLSLSMARSVQKEGKYRENDSVSLQGTPGVHFKHLN